MTLKSFPFQDVAGDRLYSDAEFADFYAKLFKDGVILTVGTGLQVKADNPVSMNVTVSSGAAIIKGRQLVNDANYEITLAAASSTVDRTDSIVVQLNLPLREILVVYKQGTVSVQRDENIYELQLATILVPKNASTITAAMITDKRSNTTVCGYSSPFETVNVTSLQDQYESMLSDAFTDIQTAMAADGDTLSAYITSKQTSFDTWFAALQDTLAANVEANLQLQIDNLKSDSTLVTITHDLNEYPDARVLAWDYGIGLTGLGDEPEGLFGGSNVVTVPCSVEYQNRQSLIIKLPIGFDMATPTVTAINSREYLLVEGYKSIQINLMEV